MKLSIRLKLALILTALLFVSTFFMGMIMIAHQRASLQSQMTAMAYTVADEFAADVKVALLQKDGLMLNQLVKNLRAYPGIEEARVYDHKLRLLAPAPAAGAPAVSAPAVSTPAEAAPAEGGFSAVPKPSADQSTGSLPNDIHAEIKAFVNALDAGTRKAQKGARAEEKGEDAQAPKPPWELVSNDDVLVLASPVVFKRTVAGYVFVRFSNGFIRERVELALTSMVAVAIFAMVIVALITLPVSSWLLRPIYRLFKGTREVALGNYDYRIPVTGNDEVSSLVKSFNEMASALKHRDLMKGALDKYVSPHVAEEIMKNTRGVRLGGERRDIAVFFADIRGFTALSKRLESEETVEFLNRYFSLVTDIVFAFDGTVDKFIGDAVMSVFGSPVPTPMCVENGVKAAVAVKTAINEANRMSLLHDLMPLKMGIGLDAGVAIVGNMGSRTRMEFTAVGDSVNMASKLSNVANSNELLITSSLYSKVSHMVVAEYRGALPISGLDGTIALYAITGLKGRWADEAKEAAYNAIQKLRREAVALKKTA